jgi:sugar/nucleoside kinase (ribokinase family)
MRHSWLGLAFTLLALLPARSPAAGARRGDAGRVRGPRLAAHLDPRRAEFWAGSGHASTVVVGSAGLDTIEAPNGRTHRELLGGSAVYAAVAAASAGLSRPQVVAPVGDDFPAAHVRALEEHGVDTGGLDRLPGPTLRWRARYLDSKDRVTLETRLGVQRHFHPRLPPGSRPGFVLLANLAPEQQLEVLDQLPAGRGRPRVLVDTMNLWIREHPKALGSVLARADLLLLNDEEARLLTGRTQLGAAARWALDRGPHMVVIKEGGAGATLFWRERGQVRSVSVPAYAVRRVVDTTGAGDSYAGGLLSYLAHTGRWSARDVVHGMAYASAVASSNVEDYGPGALLSLSRPELVRRFDTVLRGIERSRGRRR